MATVSRPALLPAWLVPVAAALFVVAVIPASILSMHWPILSAGFGILAALSLLTLLIGTAVGVVCLLAFREARNWRQLAAALTGVTFLSGLVLLVMSSGI